MASFGKLIKEGQILKNGNTLGAKAQLRYLKLWDDNTMKYYEDSNCNTLKGTIYLQSTGNDKSQLFHIEKTTTPPTLPKGGIIQRISSNSDTVNTLSKYKYGFTIYTPHPNHRTWYIYADSEKERESWMEAIVKVHNKNKKRYLRKHNPGSKSTSHLSSHQHHQQHHQQQQHQQQQQQQKKHKNKNDKTGLNDRLLQHSQSVINTTHNNNNNNKNNNNSNNVTSPTDSAVTSPRSMIVSSSTDTARGDAVISNSILGSSINGINGINGIDGRSNVIGGNSNNSNDNNKDKNKDSDNLLEMGNIGNIANMQAIDSVDSVDSLSSVDREEIGFVVDVKNNVNEKANRKEIINRNENKKNVKHKQNESKENEMKSKDNNNNNNNVSKNSKHNGQKHIFLKDNYSIKPFEDFLLNKFDFDTIPKVKSFFFLLVFLFYPFCLL